MLPLFRGLALIISIFFVIDFLSEIFRMQSHQFFSHFICKKRTIIDAKVDGLQKMENPLHTAFLSHQCGTRATTIKHT